jgi:hypothetical protein
MFIQPYSTVADLLAAEHDIKGLEKRTAGVDAEKWTHSGLQEGCGRKSWQRPAS